MIPLLYWRLSAGLFTETVLRLRQIYARLGKKRAWEGKKSVPAGTAHGAGYGRGDAIRRIDEQAVSYGSFMIIRKRLASYLLSEQPIKNEIPTACQRYIQAGNLQMKVFVRFKKKFRREQSGN